MNMRYSKGEKFLTPEELSKRRKEWQERGKISEPSTHTDYRVSRIEKDRRSPIYDDRLESVNAIHDTSFIKGVIPEMIRQKKGGKKVRILDMGAGVGFYTDQIRESFPGQVIVYSTGISKRAAKQYRGKYGYKKLNSLDLKWRSIAQLSDTEEFDLIIDTYGEQSYMGHSPKADWEIDDRDTQLFCDYISMIVRKLKPGGLASIAPIRNEYFLRKILGADFGAEITTKRNFHNDCVVQIRKPK